MKPRKLLQTLCPFIILLPGFTFAYDLSPKEQVAVEWVREGKSYEEVAEEFDTTPAHVYRWVRIEEGITGELIAPPLRNPNSFTPRERARAVQMVTVEKQKMADVARDFDTSPAEIYRWVIASQSRARPASSPRQTRQVRIDAPSTDQDIEPSQQRRGGSRPKLNDEQRAEVIRLAKERLSHRAIGERFNVTGQTIGNVVHEYEARTGDIIPRQAGRQPRQQSENVTETARQPSERSEDVIHQTGNQDEEIGRQAPQQSQQVRSEEPSTGQDVESSQQQPQRRGGPKLNDEERAEAIRLAKERLSHRAIGRRFGVTGQTIGNVVREYEARTGDIIPRQLGRRRRQQIENVTETARQPSERSGEISHQIPNEEVETPQQSQQVRSDESSTGQDVESRQQQPQRRGSKLNDEQRAEAIRLVREENRTYAEVGRRFNVSREAIRQLVYRTTSMSKSQKRVEAVHLLKAGESIEKVADKFNVSFETVVKWFEQIQHVKLGWLGSITTAGTLLYHIFSSDVLSADEMSEGVLEVFDGVIWAEELANSDLQNLDTPSIEIMDFLDRLKRQLEGYIDNGLILSEEVKEGVFEQLAEAQQKMVLDDTLDMDTRIEIYNRMADIEDLILSSQT